MDTDYRHWTCVDKIGVGELKYFSFQRREFGICIYVHHYFANECAGLKRFSNYEQVILFICWQLLEKGIKGKVGFVYCPNCPNCPAVNFPLTSPARLPVTWFKPRPGDRTTPQPNFSHGWFHLKNLYPPTLQVRVSFLILLPTFSDRHIQKIENTVSVNIGIASY